MKKRTIVILASVLLTLMTQAAFAEKMVVSFDKFEETVYRSGTLTFNNFTIFEKDGWMTPNGWNDLHVKLSGKNNGSDALSIGLQFAGKNTAGEVIWAMDIAPMMGIISEKSLEEISGSVLVKPGTLNKTKEVVVIFSGEM